MKRKCCCGGGSIPAGAESCGSVTAQAGLAFTFTVTQAGHVRGQPTGVYKGSTGCAVCCNVAPRVSVGWDGWDNSVGAHLGRNWLQEGAQAGSDPECCCPIIEESQAWPGGSWTATYTLAGAVLTQTNVTHNFTQATVTAALTLCTALPNGCGTCAATAAGYYDVLSIYVIGRHDVGPWYSQYWDTKCKADTTTRGTDVMTWSAQAWYYKPVPAGARTISGLYTRYASTLSVPANRAYINGGATVRGGPNTTCVACAASCSGAQGNPAICLCGQGNDAGYNIPATITIA